MPTLDTAEAEDVLPAFVIGYEGARPLPANPPAWLHAVHHQVAGHTCARWDATGYVVPLALNQREGTGKLWLLTRALVELGESWPGDPMYAAPEVARLVAEIARLTRCSTGSPLDAHGVTGIGELLARHLAFPGLAPPVVESGEEALIRFHAADPSPFFDSWRIVCGCPEGPWAWHGWMRYGRDLGRELQAGLGRGEPLRIFLLWENSD